ncbi:hypothetical protein [Desulfosporosinus youngiae]|uniref:Uncharacterized protein n=1 Tax=Desulfosporosinus youngiae DSM 17734 TaxID=768710 RepID=H5Y514_9FIRM|nr:hypothetical protein [Desulfosporosinus youngiae]EHQ90049.1 hypothetical protein DesyoDRAFT_3004 [Desulfosporosinus youngiae DSM 17734]
MEHNDVEILPERILGMQKLEAIFKQNGYLICQSSGERIYNFDEVAAIFLPLSSSIDQAMAVHRSHAPEFLHRCLLAQF